MTDIVVRLDSVKKYRNREEYHSIPRASCEFGGVAYEKVSHGALIVPLLKLLANDNVGISAIVRVLRGGTTCFKPVPIESWLNPTKSYPNEGLRKYQEERK